jgi:hypothetical protein
MNVEALIFTQIVDANFDQAIYTASPNSTINVVQIAAKGSGTNIGLALTPKGTGYISAQVPDSTTVGGNARGVRSVDLQTSRSTAAQVASGTGSAIIGGTQNRAPGTESLAFGLQSAATSDQCIALGAFALASGGQCLAFGSGTTASGQYSLAGGQNSAATAIGSVALGISSRIELSAGFAVGGGVFSTTGDNQSVLLIYSGKTTTNSAVSLLLFNSQRGIVRSGFIRSGILQIVGSKSDGSAVAIYMRQVCVKRVGNTTTLVGSVVTLGTDEAAGTSIAITADDTNEAIDVSVTGVSGETWRWQAIFRGGDIAYGT